MTAPTAWDVQRKNHKWQCQAYLDIDNLAEHPDIRLHICQLEKTHYGPHKCWCGTCFDEDGTVWVEWRLPMSFRPVETISPAD